MLPSPSTARSRMCTPALGHPRITTIAAIILLVACLYHATGFKPASPPSVDRNLLPVSAEERTATSLILDGAGGSRVDDFQTVDAAGSDVSEGAPEGSDLSGGAPTTHEAGPGGLDVTEAVAGSDTAERAEGPNTSEGADAPVIHEEAVAGAPGVGDGTGGPDVTEKVVHEEDGASGLDVSEGAGVSDVAENAPSVHESGAGGDDVSEVAGGPDIAEGVPSEVVETSEKQEDAATTSAAERENAVEGISEKEAVETATTDGAIDTTEKPESDALAEGQSITTAEKQEGLGADEIHGDAIEHAEKQEENGEQVVTSAESVEAIEAAEKQEEAQNGADAVTGEVLPDAEKQTESGESVDISEKQDAIPEDESVDLVKLRTDTESDGIATEERQGDVPAGEGAAADTTDGGGDYGRLY